jgi:phage terminase large subunit
MALPLLEIPLDCLRLQPGSGGRPIGPSWFEPTARQREFLRALMTHDFVLYGGAAGGGKSHVLRWGMITWLWVMGSVHRGIRAGLFCEDYPALRDRHLAMLPLEVPREIGVFRSTEHELVLANGAVLAFRNLDDPSKYLSSQFGFIAVDELTRNEQHVFDFLRMRMRWPGLERPKFAGATNPGGIGHEWVKRLWLDRDFPGELAGIANQFIYVPAKASDNPHLPSSYYENLRRLPPEMALAYAEGHWDFFAGQAFREFRRDVHVVRPFTIPGHWRRWIGNDPGFADPACWGWYAADETGRVWKYRERTFNRMPYSEQAKEVKAATGNERIDFFVTGMDAFVKDPETAKGPVDYYEQEGLGPFDEPDHGAGCRARGCGIVHEYLNPMPRPDGEPGQIARLAIFDTCTQLIRTLPALPMDEHEPEAVAACSADHWYDETRYSLQAWHARKSELPPKVARPGTMAYVLKHDQVGKQPDRKASLLRRGI